MPKMKTHSATKKRFKRTASGKLVHRHAFSSHLFEHKTAKRKRSFRKPMGVSEADTKGVKRLLGLR